MKKLLLLASIALAPLTSKAQAIEQFLAVGNDASQLLESYLQPAFEGTIYNLGNGWYRTAKTHKKLGFDITLSASLSTVPSERKTFDFIASQYSGNLTLEGGNAALPTAFGDTTDKVLVFSREIEFEGQTRRQEIKFNALGGIPSEADLDFSEVPSAMIQAGIGLPFKTDISVRYLPEIGGDDVKTNLLGFGIKHNILQYFPIAKRIPLVDVSIFGGYTKLNTEYIPGAGQSIDFEINNFTAQLLGSVDLKIINFYLGLGYTGGEATVKTTGNYSFTYDIVDPDTNTVVATKTENVDQADLPNFSFDVSGFKTTIGTSLNLAFFKIFADYSIQEYNSINAGVSFSFR